MIKKALYVSILVTFMGISTNASEMLNIQWKKKDVNISDYKDMYLLSLDLRDVKVEVYDDEDHAYYQEDISSQDYEKLANDLYERFIHRFEDVIALNSSKVVDKTQKSLVLGVKLDGLFRVNEQGWMAQKLFGEQMQEFELKMSGIVKDSMSNETIFTFKDTRKFFHDSNTVPLTDGKSMDGIWDAFDFWARQLAQQIANKKVTE